ncbi:hypothetical protein [Paenibacillus xylaniclasticus]|uniref:hypothetical protein n=1 Tax=Paenibacillus xylaniclasticus TaxID=588083 RepID=UPI000FD8F75C|nr:MULTISPECIES: hypothetical protein [Paenibacillus]GFN32402.1 hypothetical protein PCURB6_26620 [Paenibacillus curdlanolyticus]
MKITELARWNDGSWGEIEELLSNKVGIGNIAPISGTAVEDIFRLKGIVIKAGDPYKTYYVYFNWHTTLGCKTKFEITKDKKIKYKVEKPSETAFQAFGSEIVILNIKE